MDNVANGLNKASKRTKITVKTCFLVVTKFQWHSCWHYVLEAKVQKNLFGALAGVTPKAAPKNF